MRIKIDGFSLDRTINAGHTFVWQKKKDLYLSYLKSPASVRQFSDGSLEFDGINEHDFMEILGLNDDIKEINAEIDKDVFIDRAINYSSGIRVVKEGLWPSTLAFILSIQSNVPLIKRRLAVLAESYGKRGEISGAVIHQFPDFDRIFAGGVEKLKRFRLGFRTNFVFAAAEFFHYNDLSGISDVATLRERLIIIPGVGEKVLDCIMLYGVHDLSAFPMDVWIKRILCKQYPGIVGKLKSYKKINDAIVTYFGKYAGYAQLYMYNYSRMNKIK